MANKTVFISGGSIGIGSAICKKFASCEFNVAFTYLSHCDEALSLQKELSAITNCIALPCDVSNETQVQQCVQKVITSYKKIDVLVCNAGISHYSLAWQIDKKDFDKVINVNLWGVMNACKHTMPFMIDRQSGSIVNVSSFLATDGSSMESLYAASKSGVESYTFSIAKELGLSNITANCVAPGLIDTSMNDCLSHEEKEQLVQKALIKRIGTPQDVANAVYFLATSSYITATCLNVDGGLKV